jgi:putative mycofactocin binding protein MftB
MDGFDLDRAWVLAPQVALRPEPFGALVYHFGTRRLSFLKTQKLATVVERIAERQTAREACAEAGVTDSELPAYERALTDLAASGMITQRAPR